MGIELNFLKVQEVRKNTELCGATAQGEIRFDSKSKMLYVELKNVWTCIQFFDAVKTFSIPESFCLSARECMKFCKDSLGVIFLNSGFLFLVGGGKTKKVLPSVVDGPKYEIVFTTENINK